MKRNKLFIYATISITCLFLLAFIAIETGFIDLPVVQKIPINFLTTILSYPCYSNEEFNISSSPEFYGDDVLIDNQITCYRRKVSVQKEGKKQLVKIPGIQGYFWTGESKLVLGKPDVNKHGDGKWLAYSSQDVDSTYIYKNPLYSSEKLNFSADEVFVNEVDFYNQNGRWRRVKFSEQFGWINIDALSDRLLDDLLKKVSDLEEKKQTLNNQNSSSYDELDYVCYKIKNNLDKIIFLKIDYKQQFKDAVRKLSEWHTDFLNYYILAEKTSDNNHLLNLGKMFPLDTLHEQLVENSLLNAKYNNDYLQATLALLSKKDFYTGASKAPKYPLALKYTDLALEKFKSDRNKTLLFLITKQGIYSDTGEVEKALEVWEAIWNLKFPHYDSVNPGVSMESNLYIEMEQYYIMKSRIFSKSSRCQEAKAIYVNYLRADATWAYPKDSIDPFQFDEDFKNNCLNKVSFDLKNETNIAVPPNADERLLSSLDCRSLWIRRNTIFARHGRIFHNPEVGNYFSQQSWYRPDPNYNDAMISEEEKREANSILEIEKEKKCF